MVVITASDPSSAYLEALARVLRQPQFFASPRGHPIRETLNLVLTIDKPSTEPLVTHDAHRNATIAKYTKRELSIYLDGCRTAADYGKISKFWLDLANPDGTINSAYGYLAFFDASCGNPKYEPPSPGHTVTESTQALRTPFQWARAALIKDKDTRQAIVKFHKREHLWVGNKDQVCTIYLIFHIRDDRLLMTTHMRSQDLVLGMPYDLPWFAYLQGRMVSDLGWRYASLKVGPHTHIMDSAHIYERDVDAVEKMLGEPQ